MMTKGQVNATVLHEHLGHMCMSSARATAKFYGWAVTGEDWKCKACKLVKSRQANLNKEWVPRSKTHGERLFIDISYTEYVSFGKS